MPLHDWTDDRGWDSVHQLWINELLYWLQARLPPGYRAYLGSVPGLSIATESGRPDVGIRSWEPAGSPAVSSSSVLVAGPEPDFHVLALLHADAQAAIHVYCQGQLRAAIELVSPRNKERPSSRDCYRNRYLGYLLSGVHLMLIDLHRRPQKFSFVEAMAAELQCQLPSGFPPHAVSWNVGGPTPEGGRFLDGWYRALTVGQALPTLPLTLTAELALMIDLETTYNAAARRAYLE